MTVGLSGYLLSLDFIGFIFLRVLRTYICYSQDELSKLIVEMGAKDAMEEVEYPNITQGQSGR